jgi:hypothetical protein
MLMLEADNGVIRVTDDDHVAGRLAAPAVGPKTTNSTEPLSEGGRPVFFGSTAPGPATGPQRLGRLPDQPGSGRDLWVPRRRIWPGSRVDGGGPGNRPGSPGAALTTAGSVRSGRPVRRRHPVHRRPGQGRQANPKQVVPRHAVRGSLQGGFRAPGPVHQAEGRHQRMRCSFHPARGASCMHSSG